jgi:hypothetical protein
LWFAIAALAVPAVRADLVMYGSLGGHGNHDSDNDGALALVDPTTAAVTVIGHPEGVSRLTGIAFESTGRLFATTILGVSPDGILFGGTGDDHKLFSVNPATGEETLIGDTGRDFVSALAFGPPPVVPVQVTGYSVDVISDKDPSARFAGPFNGGTFAWFEAGAVDDNGTQHNDGLPAGRTFVSATGSGATYQLQPANVNNVLQLNAGQTGTLTLTTPAAYSTLCVLVSSGDGTSSSVGSGTINFADGSTQAFSFNCFDWCNGQGGLHPEAVLTGPNGRADVGPNGTAFVYNQDCDFQLYETVIAIDPSHAGVAIASIDFTGAPDAFFSNIFGVSGR